MVEMRFRVAYKQDGTALVRERGKPLVLQYRTVKFGAGFFNSTADTSVTWTDWVDVPMAEDE